MISDRELLLATANRKKEERILYYAQFAGECQRKVFEYFGVNNQDEFATSQGFFNPKTVRPIRAEGAPIYDYSKYFSEIKIPQGVKIESDGILNLPGSQHHFTHLISPLRDIYEEDEIYDLPVYRNPEHFDFSNMKTEICQLHNKGIVATSPICRLFETSWPLRGYENMLVDMLINEDVANYFLDNELKWNMELVTQSVNSGIDMLVFGDDVGNQKGMTFSATLWRQMLKPRWAQIFTLAKKINPNVVLWYHSCGDVTDIVPDLIEIGLDILNPVQPECMDPYGIYQKYGDKLSFDGGIGTQKLMPFGTPDEIATEMKKVVDIVGARGGLILSPSHVLEPEVPMENIITFIKTAQKICIR